MKVYYRTMKVRKLIAHTDAGGSSETFPFTLLDAISTLKQAWDKVTASTISNCFREAGFQVGAGVGHTDLTAEPELY